MNLPMLVTIKFIPNIISTGLQGFAFMGIHFAMELVFDQQTPSYKLIHINPDTEPPPQCMARQDMDL